MPETSATPTAALPDPGDLDDPTTAPFWAAARRHEFVAQSCRACGSWQHYARPFCLRCDSAEVEWSPIGGGGTIYSQTIVRVQIRPDLTPPYVVAIVELDEGPRLVTNIEGESAIGDHVTLAWRDPEEGPPLPIFVRRQSALGTHERPDNGST